MLRIVIFKTQLTKHPSQPVALFDFSELHKQAKTTFKSFDTRLTSFPCGNFGCLWLGAQTRHHERAPDGLMLMQDWGIVEG